MKIDPKTGSQCGDFKAGIMCALSQSACSRHVAALKGFKF